MEILAVLMRFTHIASMSFLVGGAVYSRFILASAMDRQPNPANAKLIETIASTYRSWVLAAVIALVASGTFNLLNKPAIPPGYHMWFGIKILFALHVIAVSLLMGRPGVDASKRSRWAAGVAISGLITIGISACLKVLL